MRRVFWIALLASGIGLSSCTPMPQLPADFRTSAANVQQAQPTGYQVTGTGLFRPRSGQSKGFVADVDLTLTVAGNKLVATAGSITITDADTNQTFELTPENIQKVDLEPRFHAADKAAEPGRVAATREQFLLLVDAQVLYQGQLVDFDFSLSRSPFLPSGFRTTATYDVANHHETGNLVPGTGSFTLTQLP